MHIPPENPFSDCSLWQRMLDRESESTLPPGACVGLLRSEDFVAGKGLLVLLQGAAGGMRALTREYAGAAGAGADIALLLVAGEAAVAALQAQGLSCLRALVRRNQLQPYILKTMEQLEDAGLEDFVEDLGLTFPKH